MKSYVVPLAVAICCLLLQAGETANETSTAVLTSEAEQTAGNYTTIGASTASPTEPPTGKASTEVTTDNTTEAPTATPTEPPTGKASTGVPAVTTDNTAEAPTATPTESPTGKASTGVPQVTTENTSDVQASQTTISPADSTDDTATGGTTRLHGVTDMLTVTPIPCKKKDHGFHGASFIGGIVFSAGVMAMALFLRKYYQSRQEAALYRTL